MRRLPSKLLTITLSMLVAGTVMALGDEDAATLNAISGYRQWTRVNPEPVKIETPQNIPPQLATV
ncbi:MAG TPA: hypothetical protein VE961_13320 [Pyrinomonadaceae bacterium]|nr:hypothetical protein [Pyrinomonadaceae bacterium]